MTSPFEQIAAQIGDASDDANMSDADSRDDSSDQAANDNIPADPSTDQTYGKPNADSSGPIVKFSESWWAAQSPENQKRRCTGHKKTGERCGNYAIRGGFVCNYHGGKAKQVRAKARQRLENAADRLAKELLRMALDADVDDKVKLAAIRDALDRGGLKVGEQVEISLKPYEQVMEHVSLVTSSRDDYLRSIGQAPVSREPVGYDDPPALASDPNAPIDAEVVDPHEEFARRMTGEPSHDADRADTYHADERERAVDLAGVTPPPGTGLMTLEQANEELARINAATAARKRAEAEAMAGGHARISRPTR